MTYLRSHGAVRQGRARGLAASVLVLVSLLVSWRLVYPNHSVAPSLLVPGMGYNEDLSELLVDGTSSFRVRGNLRPSPKSSRPRNAVVDVDGASNWQGFLPSRLWSSLQGSAGSSAGGQLDEPIHIATAADTSILVGLMGLVNSTRENTASPDRVHWHIISPTSDVASEIITSLEDTFPGLQAFPYGMPERLLNINFKVADPNRKGSLSRAANYARYVLGDLLPDLTKVIYIDPDTLFLKDVADLWKTDLEGKPIAAARACREMATFNKQYNMQSPFLKGKYDPDECSFNAGLMVYDLDMYRQEDYASKLLEWVEINNEHNLYHLGSQPPVNLVFYRNYKVLDSRFNRMNLAALRQPGPYGKQPYTVPPEELRQAVVVHWNGAFKPWHCEPGVGNNELWYQYVPKHAAKLAPGVSLDPMCIDGVHTQKRVDSTEHRYTVILSTAGKNLDDLRMTISRLRWLDHVGKIITLWGNEAMECPADVAAISSCIRPQAKWAETMRLLSNEITTEGVLFHSDNILVHQEDLDAAFGVWLKYSDQVLGFQPINLIPGKQLMPGNYRPAMLDKVLREGRYNMVESDVFFVARDLLLEFAQQDSAQGFLSSEQCAKFALSLYVSKQVNLPALWYRARLQTYRLSDDPKMDSTRPKCAARLIEEFTEEGRGDFSFERTRKHFYLNRPTMQVISVAVPSGTSWCSGSNGAGVCRSGGF